ncbi:hypothetical protein MTR67_012901, partial [Solanum verrucosum]
EFLLHTHTFHLQSHLACIFSCQDEGSLRDQQWFLSASHVQGVDSGRDNLSEISSFLFLTLITFFSKMDLG